MRQLIKNLFPVCLLLVVSCGVVLEIDISDEQVALLAPSDSVIIEGPDVTFLWKELDNVEQYEVLVVSPSFDKAQKLELDTLLGDVTTFTVDLEKGNYQWTVIGRNESYQTIDAIPRNFSVTEEELDTLNIREKIITAISPENQGSTTDTNILFKWEEVDGAFDYVLKVYEDENNDIKRVDKITRETEHVESLEIGDYRWEVRARNPIDSTKVFEFKFSIIPEAVTE